MERHGCSQVLQLLAESHRQSGEPFHEVADRQVVSLNVRSAYLAGLQLAALQVRDCGEWSHFYRLQAEKATNLRFKRSHMIVGQPSDNLFNTTSVDGSQLMCQDYRFDIEPIRICCWHRKRARKAGGTEA
jgi:hypothetical protein